MRPSAIPANMPATFPFGHSFYFNNSPLKTIIFKINQYLQGVVILAYLKKTTNLGIFSFHSFMTLMQLNRNFVPFLMRLARSASCGKIFVLKACLNE